MPVPVGRRTRRAQTAGAALLGLAVLAGCADSADTAAAATAALTAAYPPLPVLDCAEIGFSACQAESVERALAAGGRAGRERAERQQAGEPLFLAELSRDDLLRYAADHDQALELGRQVCRFVDAQRTGEAADLLTDAGFGAEDAALVVGAAGATMCPGA
jgi:hypothetical protein